MERIRQFIELYFDWLYIPQLHITDLIEIVFIAFVIYQIISWFQSTRAWTLFKGIIVLLLIMAFASIFKFNTILWILKKTLNIGIIAIIIIFQPEFRRALEQLGSKKFLASIFGWSEQKEEGIEGVDTTTIGEITKAAFEMSKAKTGALIVIEQDVALGEYESTGIPVDARVSSQLLLNIFEKNTPLHDGAVIIRNNRIVAATCYLPLTDRKDLDKDLGTRHRAAVGISEISDSITLVVSEENGAISIAKDGYIKRNLDAQGLKRQLSKSQQDIGESKRFKIWKGRKKNEGKTSE